MSVGAVGTVDFTALFGADPAEGGVVEVGRTEPMDAPALAVAVVPELTVTMLGDAGGGGALLVVRQYGTAVALIELGDGYLLDIDRARASVLLSNPLTGLHTTIWGEEAAVTLSDGGEAARFWGNVTFALDNGAVITAATARRDGNPMVYQLESLVVTKREAAVIVANLAAMADAVIEAEADSSLAVTTSERGWSVDYRTRDGLVLEQDAALAGWMREGSEDAADTPLLAQTAPGSRYGPESHVRSDREFKRHMFSALTDSTTRMTAARFTVPERRVDEVSRADDLRSVELRRVYLASLRPHDGEMLSR